MNAPYPKARERTRNQTKGSKKRERKAVRDSDFFCFCSFLFSAVACERSPRMTLKAMYPGINVIAKSIESFPVMDFPYNGRELENSNRRVKMAASKPKENSSKNTLEKVIVFEDADMRKQNERVLFLK